MGGRLGILGAVVGVAIFAAACGRATEEQIDAALGITPTPTVSPEEIATATAAASATSAARALAQASPDPGAEAAALGDVRRGGNQFRTWCSSCHAPGGQGGNILEPGSAGSDVTYEGLLALVRDGEGHPNPPGPYLAALISDRQVADIAAFILSEAGS